MPSTPITEAILLRLVEIGKSGDFPRPGSFFTASEQRRYSEIMRLRPETWYSAVESLSTEDLVALIKCLTVAERRLEGWKAGSVSPVIWLFRRLAALDSNLADSIVDWILANTENIYLPFGTVSLGAKSLAEYHHLKQEASQRATAGREAEAKRQDLARQRKAHQATHQLFNAVRRSDVKAVAALIRRGADVLAKDSGGVSIWEHAKMKGNQEILELLKAVGADE